MEFVFHFPCHRAITTVWISLGVTLVRIGVCNLFRLVWMPYRLMSTGCGWRFAKSQSQFAGNHSIDHANPQLWTTKLCSIYFASWLTKEETSLITSPIPITARQSLSTGQLPINRRPLEKPRGTSKNHGIDVSRRCLGESVSTWQRYGFRCPMKIKIMI